MSKLFKSKFLLGVMTFAFVFIGGLTLKGAPASANHATCSNFTMTLRYGMRNSQVLCLQQMLNDKGFPVDGVSAGSRGLETTFYGNATKAAVMVMQRAIDGAADGIFGPLSRAALLAYHPGPGPGPVGNLPLGCQYAQPTQMYSSVLANTPCIPTSTPPALCPNGNTVASSCTLPPGGTPSPSPALCPNGNTVASNCAIAPAGNATGTNGYLSDFASDSTNRVSTVYESETDKVVGGFRATARLADQKVERVRVTFKNTNSASSANLSRYITGASLWHGSTKVATISIADADRNTSTDLFTFNFSGLSAKVLRDQIGRFYVSVNANGSIDSADTTAAWNVVFPDGGVLYSSPDGSSDTAMGGDIVANSNLMFDKFSANGVKVTVGLGSSNLPATTVKVESNTVNTNGVELLKFTLKASTTSALKVRKIPVQITKSGTAKNVSDIVNSVKLYRGSIAAGNLVTSLDGSDSYTVAGGGIDFDAPDATIATTAGFLFTDLTEDLAAGSTTTYIVVVDLKGQNAGVNYADDETLQASIVLQDVVSALDNGLPGVDLNFSVQDTNGDQLSKNSTYRAGSAIGNTMTLRVSGAQVTFISSSFVAEETSIPTQDGTISIKYSVKAFGDTDVTIAEAPGVPGQLPGNDITGYTLSGPLYSDSIITSTDSYATGGTFTVSAGDTRTFTLAVKFSGTSGFTRLTINSVDGTVITNTVQTPAY